MKWKSSDDQKKIRMQEEFNGEAKNLVCFVKNAARNQKVKIKASLFRNVELFLHPGFY